MARVIKIPKKLKKKSRKVWKACNLDKFLDSITISGTQLTEKQATGLQARLSTQICSLGGFYSSGLRTLGLFPPIGSQLGHKEGRGHALIAPIGSL